MAIRSHIVRDGLFDLGLVGALALFVAALLGEVVAAFSLSATLLIAADAQIVEAGGCRRRRRARAYATDVATMLVYWPEDWTALRLRVVGLPG
jgi:hypothetical protein